MNKSGKTIKVEQTASAIRRPPNQESTLIGLGLNKLGRTSVLPDNAQVRGMIAKVKHLVRVIEGK